MLKAPLQKLGTERTDEGLYGDGRACAQVDRTQIDGGSGPGRVAVVTGGWQRSRACLSDRTGAAKGWRYVSSGEIRSSWQRPQPVARPFSPVTEFQIDLTVEDALQPLMQHLERGAGRLDVLIHCAGVIQQDPMERARLTDFDFQYATNVRRSIRVDPALLPSLMAARGQIVFINSSVGLTAKRPDIGQYAATKHALKAIADSLREEVNPKGLSCALRYIWPHSHADARNHLQARGTAPITQTPFCSRRTSLSVILHALMLPPTAEVTDISIRPMARPKGN